MKTVELLNKLANTLPVSTNGMFWTEDMLYALESLPMNSEFSVDTYIEYIEKFLPKIETDFEDRAEDYAESLWNVGNISGLAKQDPDLSKIIDHIGKNSYFHENDIDKNTIELRMLINKYKEKRDEINHPSVG